MKPIAIAAPLLNSRAALAHEPTGDAMAGKEQFVRQCISCHAVQEAAGEPLARRGARVGPNLHGVIGRVAGEAEGFDYSRIMQTYREKGAEWQEETFDLLVPDPNGVLREATVKTLGRSRMAHQVQEEQQAHGLYACLVAFSPPKAAEGESGTGEAEDEATLE